MKQVIIQLIQLQLVAKLIHWSPTNAGKLGSGEEHKVTGKLYDYLSDKIDDLIETYQGENGLLEIAIPSTKRMDIMQAIKMVCNTLEDCDKSDDCKPYMLNMIQEIEAELYRVKFKLETLK
jgi:hypothetical protein